MSSLLKFKMLSVTSDTTAPTINSVTAPSDGTYEVDDNMDFTVEFSETVTVDTGGGTPYINLTFDTYGNTNAHAEYLSGTGMDTITFRYTVQAGDEDADGIGVNSPLVLNSGTIQDAAGNNATLTFTPPTTTGVLVDAPAGDWSNYTASDDNTPVVFSSAVTQLNHVVELSSTKGVLIYRSTSNYIYGRVFTLDENGDETFGTEVAILSEAVTGNFSLNASPLSSTHVVVSVANLVGPTVKLIVFSVDGTTINAVGTAVTVSSDTAPSSDVVAVSSSEGFIAYDLNSTKGIIYYFSVSGTTPTVGNSVDFVAATADIGSIVGAKSKDGEACFIYASATGTLESFLVTPDGTTPSIDDTLQIDSTVSASNMAICRIEDEKLGFVYARLASGPAYTLRAGVITTTSSTLAKGTIIELEAHSFLTEWASISSPDAGHLIATYSAIGNTPARSCPIDVSGSSLTAGTAFNHTAGDNEFGDSVAIGGDYLAIVYEDDSNSSYGTMITAVKPAAS